MEVWKRKRCWEAQETARKGTPTAQHDDEASAASGAVPLDLATLDDSLFGSTKERRRLTRNQKRAKGTDAERFSSLS